MKLDSGRRYKNIYSESTISDLCMMNIAVILVAIYHFLLIWRQLPVIAKNGSVWVPGRNMVM